MNENEFTQIAKELVYKYQKDNLKMPVELADIYIVWNCKILLNNKALLGTPLNDGLYYEITYNGRKDEIYFDVYEKRENIAYDMKLNLPFIV